MFDDLQNQNQPNNQGMPQQGGLANQNQPQAQPASGGFNQAPQYQAAPKEDINQRIERLSSSGTGQGNGKKMYAAIGVVIILLLAGGGAFAGYYFWPQISSHFNKTAVQPEEQAAQNNEPANNENQSAETPENQPPAISADWKNCTGDADCSETQADCCDCKNGGAQMAVNLQFLSQWQDLIGERCQDTDCAAMFACKDGKAVCENGQCVFKEDAGTTASSTELLDQTASNSANLSEAVASSTIPSATSENASLDDDHDGLNNGDEAKYGTDLNNPDTDGDGYSDGAEVQSGYNPAGAGKL